MGNVISTIVFATSVAEAPLLIDCNISWEKGFILEGSSYESGDCACKFDDVEVLGLTFKFELGEGVEVEVVVNVDAEDVVLLFLFEVSLLVDCACELDDVKVLGLTLKLGLGEGVGVGVVVSAEEVLSVFLLEEGEVVVLIPEVWFKFEFFSEPVWVMAILEPFL